MEKKNYFLFVLFMLSTLLSAQTGPGGIGNSDGSNGQPRNILWLDANSLGLSNGVSVNGWPDLSGNGNDITSGGSDPSYVTSVINGNNIVRFESSDSEILDFYSDFNTSGTNGVEGNTYSFFWVAARRDISADNQYVFGGSSGSTNNNLYSGWGYPGYDLCVNHWGNNCNAPTYYTDAENEFGFISCVFDATSGSGVTRELFDIGTSVATSNNSTPLGNIIGTQLGNRPTDNYFSDVDIAEVIFYKEALNPAQRRIVENYLSTKYGINFQDAANNKYAGYGAAYVDGVTGIGQENGGNHLSTTSAGVYLVSNGALENDDFVMYGHNSSITNASSINNLPIGVESRWLKDWYFDQSGSQNVTITFDFTEGIGGEYPQVISNYTLLYRNGLAGDYSEVSASVNLGDADQVSFDVNGAELLDGYYTIGSKDETNSPIEGAPGITWYTLISGDWNDWETWTLDPSGSLPNNPNMLYPQDLTDNVVVKDGKTVTMNINNVHCANIGIDGRLDLGTTTGHTFDYISGSGRVLMAADNFPAYTDCSSFVDNGQDEGTVVYYGNNYSLSNDYTFYNLEVNMTAGQTLTFLGDYTLNGNLTITSGTVQINDASQDVITILTKGDVTIASGAAIRTGSGDTYTAAGGNNQQYHQFIVEGDFTNNGTAYFTNRTSADYYNDDDTGACEVIFNSSSRNQTALCNGVTRFNQLTCDKGTDDTYILDVSANSVSNFNLFGRNNEAVGGDGTNGGDRDGNKALRLLAGTLKLGSNIVIPELAVGNTWDIDSDARLWLYANASVTIDGGGWFAVYGTLQCSDNSSYNEITGSGTIFRGRSILKFEGGNHYINALRTSTWGTAGDHLGAYIQSGGTVNVVNEAGGYASFHLPFETNVFNMSGGELIITDQGNGGDGDDFAMIVNSNETNSNVTGGTVIIDVAQDVGTSYLLNLRAPVWNLVLRNSFSSSFPVEISAYTATDDNTATMAAMPLQVLNDFSIESATYTNSLPDYSTASDVTFNTNDADIYIGRHFNIYEGATYDFGTNTTTFNGTEDAELYIGFSTPNNGYEQYFNDFILDKTAGKSLTIKGDEEKEIQYQLDNGYYPYRANLVHVIGNLTIESGVLNQGEHNVRLYGSNTIKKDGQCGVYEDGVTNPFALVMLKDGVVNTQEGAVFGNIKVHSGGNTVSFTSDVYIKRVFYEDGTIDLGTYNLKVDYLDRYASTASNNPPYSYSEFAVSDGSVSKMIFTSGNASDGGVSLLVTRDGTYGFPIGVNGKYTPVEVVIDNFIDEGYITLNPADGELMTTDQNGGDLLDYYWRIRHSDFGTLPRAKYRFEYDETDVVGNESNYYPGRVLGVNPYTRSHIHDTGLVDDVNNIIIYDDESGGTIPLVEANYTAGRNNRFTGDVEVFYNRRNNQGSWNDKNSWFMDEAETDAANKYPVQGDVAVIRGDNYNDNITVSGSEEAAEVVFVQEGTYVDIESLPRLRIEPGASLTVDRISGWGDLYLQRTTAGGATLNADIGDFASNENSVIEFYTTQNGTYNVPESDFFTEVPTLRIYGQGNTNRIVSFNYDINCKNLIVDGRSTLYVGGNYSVESTTRLGFTYDGRIQFPNGSTAYTFTTNNFLTRTGKGSEAEEYTIDVETGNSNAVEHKLIIEGDIDFEYFSSANGSDFVNFDLYNSVSENNVILEFQGTGVNSQNSLMTAGQTNIDLYKVIVNKGVDAANTFTFNNDFDLLGENSGVGITKALSIDNGSLILNNSNINIDLTTGDDNFVIPSTGALEVRQGTVNATGNSGISLDGLLKVSGGTVNMLGGDNPIVYSASANATIEVTDGNLWVGSQIRRQEYSTEGILNYTQSGGVVTVGQDAAGIDSRGIFEVLNSGSSFTHSAGSFTIVNDLRSNPSTSSFYFAPETNAITSGTTIHIGNSNSVALGSSISIFGDAALENLTIDNVSGEGVNLTANVVPITLEGDLDILNGAEFDVNGLDLIIKGNYNNEGVFTSNNNDTYFSGSSDQTITSAGTGSFYNLYKDTSNKLTLMNDVNVDKETHLISGAFDDGGFSLITKGDLYIDVNTISSGGNGIVANGTEQQHLYGSPTLAVFKMDNVEGVKVPIGNQITISENLIMNRGIFDIDQNLLVIEKGASITEASSFSDKNMIQTNISFTDAGIKKYFNTISSLTNFIYPIGSQGKYTPVDFAITSMNEDAAIRVKAANEHQPTVQDGLGLMGAGETDNVLQYYWILDAENTSDVAASVVMQAYGGDESVTGGNTTSEYITARLRSRSSGLWDKYGNASSNDYNEGTHELTFTLSGDDDQIDGDYTAGIDDAIPDQVALYVSQTDGNWGDASTWLPNITGGPRGARVLVRHEVDMETNYKISYETRIDNGGKLKVNESYGHRLGNVIGTGTLYLERGDMPAGEYDGFFAADSGRIEYGYTGVLDGSEDYDILSSITACNTVVVSGDGTRRLPNIELQLYGDLIIGDVVDAETPILVNEHSQKLNIQKDFIFNKGTYTSKTDANCTINFNGTAQQTISGAGAFIDANSSSLFNLELNNMAGLLLDTDIEIAGDLTFGSGILYSSNLNTITITNAATDCVSGTSNSNYVFGPLFKTISAGDEFDFPVGAGGRYGNVIVSNVSNTGNWEAQYYNNNPSNDGFDVDEKSGDVEYVSHNEYWRVKAPVSGHTANLKLRWDGGSGVTPDDNFRVVKWTDLATDAWEDIDITNKGSNPSSGTVELLSDLTFGFDGADDNHYITFGSILIPTFDWLGDESGDESNWFNPGNWGTGTVPGAGTDITIGSVSNPPVIDNSGIAQVNNLTINSGIILTLDPGARMTINGDVVCDNNAIVIKNSVVEPVSLIHYGTITNGSGTDRAVQVDWTYSDNRYYYIGHSTDYEYSNYDTPTVNPFNLYSYPGSWSRITSLTGSENKLTGYAVKFGEARDVTISHSGRLNNGTYLYTLNGNNLLANPYQSYIDVESSGFNPPSEADVTIYTSTNASGVLEYAAYNWDSKVGVNGGTRYIAPGQGFWVVGNSSTEFTMTPAARTHSFDSGNGMLKSVSQQPQNILRLKLFNEGMSDEIAMVFREDGDMELSKSDSKKRMGSGPGLPNLFSLKGGSKVAIGVYPNTDNIGSIPLGYTFAEEKELTIKATNIRDFNEAEKVYLVDKFEDIVVDLIEDSEYHFIASGTEESDRFELRFEVGITTDIDEEQQTVSNSNVMIFVVKKKATVRVSEELLRGAKKIIEVYDLLGQVVAQHELNNAETRFDLPEANTMYIIKVSIDKSSYQEKVIAQM